MARSGALAGLIVSLGLDAAEFYTGLTKSEAQARKFADTLERGIATAGRVAAIGVAAIGTAAVVAAVAMDRLVKQAAEFKDLEEKTGASAESLASFAVSAAVAGSSMQQVATASIMMTKNLTGVNDESKAAGAALTALGIPIKEFKALDPATQMEVVAKALAKFADGSGKTAVAIALLGKAGAEALPFLKELGQEGGRQVILTQRQIDLADEYADKQARVVAEIKLYAQAAATEALPAVTAITRATKEFIAELLGVDRQTKALRESTAIRDFAESAVTALGFVVDVVDVVTRKFAIVGNVIGATAAQLRALAQGDLKAYTAIQADASKTIDAIIAKEQFGAKLARQIADQRRNDSLRSVEDRGFKPPGRELNFSGPTPKGGAGRAAISEAQRYLENLQKQLQKTDELSAAETVLADIRAGRLKLSGNITQERLVGIAQQIDEAKALKKSLEEEAKAREVNSRATIKAHEAAVQDVERMAEQNAALRDEIALIDADVAARKAIEQARISSAIALKQDTVAMLENAGASPALIASMQQQINLLRERGALLGQRSAIDQGIEDATKAQRAYALTLDRVGLAQRRIDIAADSGAITSLEALRQRSDAAKSYIGTLQKQLAATEALARLEINPIKREDALHRVEQMRVELEALAAQGDLVAKKFNDLFAGSFANSLSDFIDGTKSAKDAFKDFAKSVTQQINQIASQNIAESLFGKGGIGAGMGDFFSGLFGGPSKAATRGGDPAAAAASASAAAASTLAATTTTSTTAIASLGAATAATTLAFPVLDLGLGSLALAAQTAAAALLTVSGSKGAGALGDLFSGLAQGGGYAKGGDPPVGKWSLVGEKGPELFMPKVAGTIIPNHALKSGVFDRPRLAQRRIDVATEGGATLQAMRQRSNATKAYIGVLQKQLATVEAIARAEVDPLKRGDALYRAEQLNEQIEALLAALANIKNGGSSDLFSVGGFSSGKFGHFAAGGTPPVGRPSWVGERGPELFVPKMAGTIVSNHALKTIGGDTVNIVNNIITAPAGPSFVKDTSKDFAKSIAQQINNLFESQSTTALATVATTGKDLAFTGFIGLTAAAETAAAALLSMSSRKNVAAFTQPAASRLSADFDRTQQSTIALARRPNHYGYIGSDSPLSHDSSLERAHHSPLRPIRSPIRPRPFTTFWTKDATGASAADALLLGLSTTAKTTTKAFATVANTSAAVSSARRDVRHAKNAYDGGSQKRLLHQQIDERHVAQAMMHRPKPALWLRPQADRALTSLDRYTSPRAVAHVLGLPRASVWRSPGVLPGLETLAPRAKPVVADAALLGLSTMALSTTAALTTIAMTSTPLSVGFITLTTAAETAAAMLLSMRVGKEAAASNFLGNTTGLFSGYAHGGSPPVGVPSWVGEHGRELFVPKVAGTIVPNDKLMARGGDTVSNVIHINVPAGTQRASASQIGLEVASRLNHSTRRNG